jgi:putative DNA primase/helicase
MLLGATPGLDDARHVLMLVGPRKGGKSTLLELFRLLVPDYAISAVAPTSWNRDYDKAMLSGKKLNLVTELGANKLVSGSDAKSIISFEVVKARLPYQEPFFFRPKAWHVFASNTVPRTDDEDPAFERRFVGLRLDKTLQPNEVDPFYLAKVKGELAGVVAWFVEGAARAMRRGYFVCPPGHAEIIAEMQFGDDLFARFVITMVEKVPDSDPGVSTKAINAALARFAQREGRVTDGFTPTTGARRIATLLRTLHGATQYQLSGVPHYRCIRLKPGA